MGRARSSNLHATGARAARSENQSRGTELSGAETGGENPPERPLFSRRDREREKQAARSAPKRLFSVDHGFGGSGRLGGGRDRDRTCDPLDVNEVLSR